MARARRTPRPPHCAHRSHRGSHRAERIATSIRRPRSRSAACGELIEVAATAGQLERCARLLRLTTSHPYWHAHATTSIALVSAAAGDHTEATALIATIDDPELQAVGWLRFAQHLLTTGDIDAAKPALVNAEECATRVTDSTRRAWTHLRILRTVADAAGNPDETARLYRRAVELAGNFDTSDWESTVSVGGAMRWLVSAAVQAGALDRAEAIARATEQPFHRDFGLTEIVDATLARNETDAATALARTIADDGIRADALAAVAAAQLAAGAPQTAAALAADITHASNQPRFWLTLAAAAPASRASRFVINALHTGPWHKSVNQLVRVAPHALTAILEECGITPPH